MCNVYIKQDGSFIQSCDHKYGSDHCGKTKTNMG